MHQIHGRLSITGPGDVQSLAATARTHCPQFAARNNKRPAADLSSIKMSEFRAGCVISGTQGDEHFNQYNKQRVLFPEACVNIYTTFRGCLLVKHLFKAVTTSRLLALCTEVDGQSLLACLHDKLYTNFCSFLAF